MNEVRQNYVKARLAVEVVNMVVAEFEKSKMVGKAAEATKQKIADMFNIPLTELEEQKSEKV